MSGLSTTFSPATKGNQVGNIATRNASALSVNAIVINKHTKQKEISLTQYEISVHCGCMIIEMLNRIKFIIILAVLPRSVVMSLRGAFLRHCACGLHSYFQRNVAAVARRAWQLTMRPNRPMQN